MIRRALENLVLAGGDEAITAATIESLAALAAERRSKDNAMTEVSEKLLIDVRELSELTGISVGGLYHMVSERRIPCVKLSKRCLRFSLPVIREWLAAMGQPSLNENQNWRKRE
jgi:predicted DNA-binding transcriptional regulator AlpA